MLKPKWQDNNNQLQCRIGTISFFHTMGLDVSITFSFISYTGFWEHFFLFSVFSEFSMMDNLTFQGYGTRACLEALVKENFPPKTATLLPGACELHTSRSPHSTPMEHTEESMQVWPSHQPWGPRFSKAQLFPSGPIEFTELTIFLAIDKKSSKPGKQP